MGEQAKNDLVMRALDYANRKALEAIRDMPRNFRRLDRFKEVWGEAIKEYLEDENRAKSD